MAAALRMRAVKAEFSRVRITSGPWPPLDLVWSLCANLASRLFRRALAGVNSLTAATMPCGMDLKPPSDARPIRLMASWYSFWNPLLSFQANSDA